nr:DUF1573 domain-containing protein [uncultured Draconibacterium sp.]
MNVIYKIYKCLISFGIILFFISCSSFSSNKGETKHFEINQEIEETITYELGILKMNDEKELKLILKNQLEKPVIINDIRGFCGCTIPSFSKEPVLPGKSSEVLIVFQAHQTGIFNKELRMYLSTRKKPVNIIFNGEIKSLQ